MRSRILLAIGFIVGICTHTLGDEQMTREQIRSLVLGSKARFTSLSCDMKMSVFDPETGYPIHVEQVRWLWTPQKSRVTKAILVPRGIDKGTVQHHQVVVHSDQWTKSLQWKTDGSVPSGIISPPIDFSVGYDILEVVWTPFGRSFTRLVLENPEAKVTKEGGMYIIEVPFTAGVRGGRIVVDPAKGYIPTLMEMIDKDGEVAMFNRCRDFRQVAEDVWLPYIVESGGKRGIELECEISQAQANIAIPPESLDIRFPFGTRVRNTITKRKYMAIGSPFIVLTSVEWIVILITAAGVVVVAMLLWFVVRNKRRKLRQQLSEGDIE